MKPTNGVLAEASLIDILGRSFLKREHRNLCSRAGLQLRPHPPKAVTHLGFFGEVILFGAYQKARDLSCHIASLPVADWD